MMSGRATLFDCTLSLNVAKIFSTKGTHASGGAAAIGASGSLDLIGARMLSNDAGGRGEYENNLNRKDLSGANGVVRAAHIDCAGKVALVDSSILSPLASSLAELGVGQLEFAASASITGSGAGAITLRDCTFESAVAGSVLLRLIGSQSQSVMRACTVVNMTVDVREGAQLPQLRSTVRFAAVSSTFEPPLPNSTSLAAVQPPDCSAIIAGETVCDPRATCRSRLSGGVECACTGEGLQYMPGVIPDGQQCQQATRVNLQVQSKTIILKVRKPSNHSEKLAVTVRADGETKFRAWYSLGITHVSGSDENGTVLGNASWPLLNDTLLYFHGFSLLWDVPPSEDAEVELDGGTRQFTALKSYTYQLRLDCGKKQPCIADGDQVETMMQIGTPSDSSSMRSEVRFVTEVEALVSCENSQAWVEHDVHNLPARTPFRVRIIAVDVDGMPVSFTRAEIAFLFDNKSLSVQWSRGSNEYVAIASEDLTNDTGEHTLVVRVTHGWSQADSRTRDCVLLHRVITVIPDRSQVILAGCLASVLLLATGGVGYVLLRNRERALSLFLSFLSFEGLMLIEVLLELWGTVNPRPHPHLAPKPHAQALDLF